MAFLAGCGSKGQEGPPDPAVVLARDRAADLGARARWSEARAALEPLVKAPDAALEDLLRAACAELAIQDAENRAERALPLLERAARLAPEDPRLLWCRYRMAAIAYDMPRAVEILRRLHAQRPDDFTVGLALASALDDLDEPAAEQEAQDLYRRLLALPAERTGSWRMTMLYRLAQGLIRQGRSEEADPLFEESTRLEAQGVARPGVPAHEPGTLGALEPQTPGLFDLPRPAPDGLRFASGAALAGPQLDVRVVQLALDGLVEVGEEYGADREELYAFRPAPSVVAFGAQGLAIGPAAGALVAHTSGPVLDLVPLDRRNVGATKSSDRDKPQGDQDLDFLFVDGDGRLRWLENVAGQWRVGDEPLASLPEVDGPGRLLELDYDHDGDLDLVACGPRGPRLFRNDGLDGSGALTEVTAEAGLPPGDWSVRAEDMDRDNDVDLLFLSRSGGAPALASNERGGRFSNASASLPAGLRGEFVVAADFDGDSWPDLATLTGTELTLYTRTELGGWRAEARRFALAHRPTGEPRAVDLDLDGSFDLVWPCAEAPAAALLAPGFTNGGVEVLLGEPFATAATGPARLAFADLDGDDDLDFLRLDAAGLRTHLREGRGQAVTLALRGHKDNARGVGAIVEVRSGLAYRRLYMRGTPELLGFGGARIDVVRVTWPNGIVQGNFGLRPGAHLAVAQRIGLVGSCPFLYTWNGTTYEFVSDVLGITPLGLPMAPGMLVPPDHDEYVLIRGSQLVPRDGVYELQLTEELREVTYLDHLRLDVVDHPAEVEVFPNERFTFPPFPEAHTHTVRAPLAPLSALDGRGRDWSAELARDDLVLAQAFTPLPGPYTGLAEPYTLELTFDPERVAAAPRLRLFANGWFYWTDASVNMAVAHHPDHAFVPPLLSVPDGEGGWRECGPIGFPAGKLKTMVFDVSELVNRADPRLRLTSTLCLAWDSIRLGVDADDAPTVTTALAPSSARLWERGFSRARRLVEGHDGEWFEWEALEPEPRWNQHPGLYTRLGETVPLLQASDDRFVILGAGDALTVRFEAAGLPVLPDGWRRDFLLYLDGWAKDRDPNTLEALYVEPLPFHGMSGYPYGADERYPDDAEHRAYREQWNTRAARRWID